eukprot:483315-Hanusia_phi.AAC.1
MVTNQQSAEVTTVEAQHKFEPKLERLHGTMLQEFLILQAKRAQAETEQAKRALAVAEKDRDRLYQENQELQVQLEGVREELEELQQKYSSLRECATIMYANLLHGERGTERQSRESAWCIGGFELLTKKAADVSEDTLERTKQWVMRSSQMREEEESAGEAWEGAWQDSVVQELLSLPEESSTASQEEARDWRTRGASSVWDVESMHDKAHRTQSCDSDALACQGDVRMGYREEMGSHGQQEKWKARTETSSSLTAPTLLRSLMERQFIPYTRGEPSLDAMGYL